MLRIASGLVPLVVLSTWLWAAPSEAAVRDVVFVIDGTASMGGGCFHRYESWEPDADYVVVCEGTELFEAQKTAVKRAVALFAPLGGRVAVTVIQNQYHMTSYDISTGQATFDGPRVEVLRKLIVSDDDRREVIARIDAIEQLKVSPCMGGYIPGRACAPSSFSPGWALKTAADLLAAADPGSSKEVCFVGDYFLKNFYLGSGFTPVDVPEEAFNFPKAYAAMVNAGLLDRFAVVNLTTIDGPDVAGLSKKRNDQWVRINYGKYARGGGRVTTADDAEDFAFTIPNGCMSEPVELVGIEATQVVQDLQNSVALVPFKPTAVRAFVQSERDEGVPADVVLKGARVDGTSLGTVYGRFSPLRAKPHALTRRGQIFEAQLFDVPPHWFDSDVVLEVEQPGVDMTCNEFAPTPEEKDCKVTLIPDPPPTVRPNVEVLRISPASLDPDAVPTEEEMDYAWQRANQLLPTDHLVFQKRWDVRVTSVTLPPDASFDERLDYLRILYYRAQEQRADDCLRGRCGNVHFGVFKLPDSVGGPWGRSAARAWRSSTPASSRSRARSTCCTSGGTR